jgi:FkbM family methyltransferase
LINYHHIGGRNGTFPLPIESKILKRDFHLYLYDADENCHAQMTPVDSDCWASVTTLPYCIGADSSEHEFNINYHPTTSSLYKFNPAYKDYTYVDNPKYGSYILGDAFKHIKSHSIKTHTLTTVIDELNLEPIDYLSLDVQGAEYDIINSSQQLLLNYCTGLRLEIGFADVYKNQKLFHEMHPLLDSLGFELIDLDLFGRCSPTPVPLGFRGVEQPLYGEATYIKNIQTLHESKNTDLFLKAALFALLHEKVGMCLHYLNNAEIYGWPEIHNTSVNSQYTSLLLNIWQLYKEQKQQTLPSISQLIPHDSFQHFYRTNQSTYNTQELLHVNKKILKLKDQMNNTIIKNTSALEALLLQYKLPTIAQSIKENRLKDTRALQEISNNLKQIILSESTA